MMLSRMTYPQYPVPLGVLRAVERPTYEAGVIGQVAEAQRIKHVGTLQSLYETGDTWTVAPRDDANPVAYDGPGGFTSQIVDLLERYP
jgi:hypothetical protein